MENWLTSHEVLTVCSSCANAWGWGEEGERKKGATSPTVDPRIRNRVAPLSSAEYIVGWEEDFPKVDGGGERVNVCTCSHPAGPVDVILVQLHGCMAGHSRGCGTGPTSSSWAYYSFFNRQPWCEHQRLIPGRRRRNITDDWGIHECMGRRRIEERVEGDTTQCRCFGRPRLKASLRSPRPEPA